MEELNADNDIDEEIEEDEEEEDNEEEVDADNIDEGVAGNVELDDGRDGSGACS